MPSPIMCSLRLPEKCENAFGIVVVLYLSETINLNDAVAWGYAILMNLNMIETAVHSCHYKGGYGSGACIRY